MYPEAYMVISLAGKTYEVEDVPYYFLLAAEIILPLKSTSRGIIEEYEIDEYEVDDFDK